MIDKDAFLAGIALLAGAFGRVIDGPVQRAYYGILSSRLSTEEFQRAVSAAMSEETFWPSPAVLLGKVKADDESRGLLALEHVNRVTSAHGGFRFLPNSTYHAEFDPPTRAAIAALGGLAAMSNVHDDRWAAVQRRFVSAYTDFLRPRIAAPSRDQVDPLVKQLVRETAGAMSGRDRAAGRDE